MNHDEPTLRDLFAMLCPPEEVAMRMPGSVEEIRAACSRLALGGLTDAEQFDRMRAYVRYQYAADMLRERER